MYCIVKCSVFGVGYSGCVQGNKAARLKLYSGLRTRSVEGRQGSEKENKYLASSVHSKGRVQTVNSIENSERSTTGGFTKHTKVTQCRRYLNLFPSAMPNRVYFCNWTREPKITMNRVKSPLFRSVKVHCSKPPPVEVWGWCVEVWGWCVEVWGWCVEVWGWCAGVWGWCAGV